MYKLQKQIYMGNESYCVIKTLSDNSYMSIPFDPANTDYQAFTLWLDDGNTPIPADEVTE